jgi:hypothetical protein
LRFKALARCPVNDLAGKGIQDHREIYIFGSEPIVVLSGFDGWLVIKGPLYRAGTTPPSIRRSAPVM